MPPSFRMDCITFFIRRTMKSIVFVLVWLLLMASVVSCKKETSEAMASDSIARSSFTFLKSVQASNDANLLRSADYSAPFEIAKVVREKESLSITVTYPEGCGDSEFEIIWNGYTNGLTTVSYPEIVFLYLKRSTHCAVSGNISSRVLQVNLAACLGSSALAGSAKVMLCNTSKKANTENSDIAVSSN